MQRFYIFGVSVFLNIPLTLSFGAGYRVSRETEAEAGQLCSDSARERASVPRADHQAGRAAGGQRARDCQFERAEPETPRPAKLRAHSLCRIQREENCRGPKIRGSH